jgi:hypothetical protein
MICRFLSRDKEENKMRTNERKNKRRARRTLASFLVPSTDSVSPFSMCVCSFLFEKIQIQKADATLHNVGLECPQFLCRVLGPHQKVH